MQVSQSSVVKHLTRIFRRPNLSECGLEELLNELDMDPVIEIPLLFSEVNFVPEKVHVVTNTVLPKYKSLLTQCLMEDQDRYHLVQDAQLPSKESLFICMATMESGGTLSSIVAGLVSSMPAPKLLMGTDSKYGYSIVSIPVSAFSL